jgi:crotonobetainyl-CoA:carnitine CoA-transferase CaiB-like acyl-CoA transferase
VIDVTHVLAGPFAAYQLAVLGADVIKVEHPDYPDQSRGSGTDKELNRRNMGTSFLTQASNKRSITLNLKLESDREILKKLVATADVFVENYRPGAFDALGLGYEALASINPRLIYASFSAFGQRGPRGRQTAYDHVIQATSGIVAIRSRDRGTDGDHVDAHCRRMGGVSASTPHTRRTRAHDGRSRRRSPARDPRHHSPARDRNRDGGRSRRAARGVHLRPWWSPN